MKTKKLIMAYYKAIRDKNIELQKKLYAEITKKSFQGKKTQVIK